MIQKLSKKSVRFKYNKDAQITLDAVQRRLKDKQTQYRAKLLLNITKLISLWIRYAYPGCPFSTQPTVVKENKENYKMFIDTCLYNMKDVYYRPHDDYSEPEDIRCIKFFKKMMDSFVSDMEVADAVHSFSRRHHRVQGVSSIFLDVTACFENIGKERLIERFRKHVVNSIHRSWLGNIAYYEKHKDRHVPYGSLRMNYICFKNDIPTINVVHSGAILNQQWLIFVRRYNYLFDIPTT